MPHTNRKKKGAAAATPKRIQHTKRQEIEDDEGWTHVVDTPSTRRRAVDIEKVLKGQAGGGGDFELNGVAYVNRTVEELARDLEYYTRKWEESDACKGLEEVLKVREGKVLIGDVVALGLGSLMIARREHRRASFTQLAALRTIMKAFGLSKLVLQDPTFTSLEKEFLASLGYTVVEDPAALEFVTESSLVYAIHCYVELYQAVSEKALPAMVIMNDLEQYGSSGKSLEAMVEECEAVTFPQWKGDVYRADFAFTKIYWRRNGTREALTGKVESITDTGKEVKRVEEETPMLKLDKDAKLLETVVKIAPEKSANANEVPAVKPLDNEVTTETVDVPESSKNIEIEQKHDTTNK